ncbi:hypothetical protein VPH35_015855 [Triticum aestivum]|uniref:probable inactive receptor kinase At3g08680 n=1 Tax=Triticum aestivum TaxID=4565 RepID=UPI0008435FFE|nr:probable inactive receptor kinase At3g08680 [Triticum aestivum]
MDVTSVGRPAVRRLDRRLSTSKASSLPSMLEGIGPNSPTTGTIPTSLASKLAFLDLSYNSFVGEIPLKVQNMTGLIGLSLQNNSLSGPIPDLHLPKLRNCTTSSQCSNCPDRGQKPLKIAVVAVGTVILLIIMVILVVCTCKRKRYKPEYSNGYHVQEPEAVGRAKKSKPEYSSGYHVQEPEVVGRAKKSKLEYSGGIEAERNKLVFFEGCSYDFDLDDLVRASGEVLGKGTYGPTYKAGLEDGTTVVVKRLKEVVVGKKVFESRWR